MEKLSFSDKKHIEILEKELAELEKRKSILNAEIQKLRASLHPCGEVKEAASSYADGRGSLVAFKKPLPGFPKEGWNS